MNLRIGRIRFDGPSISSCPKGRISAGQLTARSMVIKRREVDEFVIGVCRLTQTDTDFGLSYGKVIKVLIDRVSVESDKSLSKGFCFG